MIPKVESFQDFLIELDMKPRMHLVEIITFSKKVPTFLSALLIILVNLTMTLCSEKILISNRCISGLMPDLIKKSWTVSTVYSLIFLGKLHNFEGCMYKLNSCIWIGP